MMRRPVLGGILLGALAGCSPSADIAVGQSGVATFHQQLNAGQFDAIYDGADVQLKRATTQATMVQLLTAVQRKLGLFQSGKSAGWTDNTATSGHFLTLNYVSSYTRGTANESFIYRLDGPTPLLAGYHINSNALIVN